LSAHAAFLRAIKPHGTNVHPPLKAIALPEESDKRSDRIPESVLLQTDVGFAVCNPLIPQVGG